MESSVNISNMAKVKRLKEVDIAKDYQILQSTSGFLMTLKNRKVSELEYLIHRLEVDYSDPLQERVQKVFEEIQNLEKKMKWEIKQCNDFDIRVKKFQEQEHLKFVSDLSKKILGKK